jgi:predicted ATPase
VLLVAVVPVVEPRQVTLLAQAVMGHSVTHGDPSALHLVVHRLLQERLVQERQQERKRLFLVAAAAVAVSLLLVVMVVSTAGAAEAEEGQPTLHRTLVRVETEAREPYLSSGTWPRVDRLSEVCYHVYT